MNKKHIEKNLRQNCITCLSMTVVFLCFLLYLFFSINFHNAFNPIPLKNISNEKDLKENVGKYIHATTSSLEYTGFDYNVNGKKAGEYYYYLSYPEVFIVLVDEKISDDTGKKVSFANPEEGASLGKTHFDAKLLKADKQMQSLIQNMANEVGWVSDGIDNLTADYYLSVPDYNPGMFKFFYLTILACIVVCAVLILYFIVLFIDPINHPAILAIKQYGNPKELIELANKELEEEMSAYLRRGFLTENFFIDLTPTKVLVLPIDSIGKVLVKKKSMDKSETKSDSFQKRHTLYLRMKDGRTFKGNKYTISEFKTISDHINMHNN